MTKEEFMQMVETQGGVCPLCGLPFDDSVVNTRACVDHDHKTGKLRGILHDRCNVGLGIFKDDIELLKKAIVYLEKNRVDV